MSNNECNEDPKKLNEPNETDASNTPHEPIEDAEDEFTKTQRPLMHLFIHVWKLHGHVLDKVTVHQGIYKSQMKMLGHIFHNEGISQRELAQQLEISPPSIAVTAKKLEKMGYIRRQMDEKDNRMNILNTTEEGRELLGRTWMAFTGVDARMFEGFSIEEMKQMEGYYKRLQANLEKIDGEMD